MKKLLSLILSLALGFATNASSLAQIRELSKKLKDFDGYVENARKEWGAQGIAVTVIKDNTIIFKKVYGVREMNTDEKVDTNTLFSCGSTTKAMTATCLGMLVDEGKLDWNDHVIDYLPEFQLYNPYVTRELRIRDLLIHDSGVGNADFLWALMEIPGNEVLEKMQMVEPSYSFRAGFIYQNIFYLAAGKVIEKVSSLPWDAFIKQRIFQPLGMNRTVPFLKDIKDGNKTKPHMNVNGKMTVIEDLSADAIGPAGSVWSSINDISKWTQCMLDSGKYDGGRLIKTETWIEMTKPQTMVPPNEFYPTAQLTKPNWTTYGFGWFQHDYKGRKINFHTGSLPGSIAMHGQIPEERIAFYFFGNTDHVEMRHALMYKAFDLFALGGTTDWSSDFLKLYNDINKSAEDAQAMVDNSHIPNTKPSLALAEYAGKYSDDLYGIIEIEAHGNSLHININNKLQATLPHWHYDTFRGPYDKGWFGKATLRFQLNNSGNIESLNLDGMVFKRVN